MAKDARWVFTAYAGPEGLLFFFLLACLMRRFGLEALGNFFFC